MKYVHPGDEGDVMARFRSRLPAALLVSFAIAGCSDAETEGQHTDQPAAVSEATLAPGDADNPRLPAHDRSGPWKLIEASASGSTITVSVAEGGCLEFKRLVVSEGVDHITITSVLHDTTRPGIVCNTVLTTHEVTVRLREKLGERGLIHSYVQVLMESAP